MTILPIYGGRWRDGGLVIFSEPLGTIKRKARVLRSFSITKLIIPFFGLGWFEVGFWNLQPKRILTHVNFVLNSA